MNIYKQYNETIYQSQKIMSPRCAEDGDCFRNVIWQAFKMHANIFHLCITGPVIVPVVWTDYENKKIAQRKLLRLILVPGISLACPFTLGPGSSFNNQDY